MSKKLRVKAKRVSTIEKHEAMYQRYLNINRELIEKSGPEVAAQISLTYRYQIIAEEFFLTWRRVREIIIQKLHDTGEIVIKKDA